MSTRRKSWDELGEPTFDAERDAGDHCGLIPRALVEAFQGHFPCERAAIERATSHSEETDLPQEPGLSKPEA